MARLAEVPREVLALHPFIALMGVCVVRVAYRMAYEHEAAKRLLATIHQQGWIVLGLLDDDPAKQGGAHRRRGSAGSAGRRGS